MESILNMIGSHGVLKLFGLGFCGTFSSRALAGACLPAGGSSCSGSGPRGGGEVEAKGASGSSSELVSNEC